MVMRKFHSRDLKSAIEFSCTGGQSLHLHRIVPNLMYAPSVFRYHYLRGENLAHLFDQDKARLLATAYQLGVRVMKVEREGTPSQHIDLCGRPLKRAIELCDNKDEQWEEDKDG